MERLSASLIVVQLMPPLQSNLLNSPLARNRQPSRQSFPGPFQFCSVSSPILGLRPFPISLRYLQIWSTVYPAREKSSALSYFLPAGSSTESWLLEYTSCAPKTMLCPHLSDLLVPCRYSALERTSTSPYCVASITNLVTLRTVSVFQQYSFSPQVYQSSIRLSALRQSSFNTLWVMIVSDFIEFPTLSTFLTTLLQQMVRLPLCSLGARQFCRMVLTHSYMKQFLLTQQSPEEHWEESSCMNLWRFRGLQAAVRSGQPSWYSQLKSMCHTPSSPNCPPIRSVGSTAHTRSEEGDSMMAPRDAKVPPAITISQVFAEAWEASRQKNIKRILTAPIQQMIMINPDMIYLKVCKIQFSKAQLLNIAEVFKLKDRIKLIQSSYYFIQNFPYKPSLVISLLLKKILSQQLMNFNFIRHSAYITRQQHKLVCYSGIYRQ